MARRKAIAGDPANSELFWPTRPQVVAGEASRGRDEQQRARPPSPRQHGSTDRVPSRLPLGASTQLPCRLRTYHVPDCYEGQDQYHTPLVGVGVGQRLGEIGNQHPQLPGADGHARTTQPLPVSTSRGTLMPTTFSTSVEGPVGWAAGYPPGSTDCTQDIIAGRTEPHGAPRIPTGGAGRPWSRGGDLALEYRSPTTRRPRRPTGPPGPAPTAGH
jgi:hypothetical protein